MSEIARNAFAYAGRGTVEFAVEGSTPPQLLISVRDEGPSIADLAHVLSDNTGWPPEWVSDSWAGTA